MEKRWEKIGGTIQRIFSEASAICLRKWYETGRSHQPFASEDVSNWETDSRTVGWTLNPPKNVFWSTSQLPEKHRKRQTCQFVPRPLRWLKTQNLTQFGNLEDKLKKELREPSAETFSTAADWETNVRKCKELGVGGTLHKTRDGSDLPQGTECFTMPEDPQSYCCWEKIPKLKGAPLHSRGNQENRSARHGIIATNFKKSHHFPAYCQMTFLLVRCICLSQTREICDAVRCSSLGTCLWALHSARMSFDTSSPQSVCGWGNNVNKFHLAT